MAEAAAPSRVLGQHDVVAVSKALQIPQVLAAAGDSRALHQQQIPGGENARWQAFVHLVLISDN